MTAFNPNEPGIPNGNYFALPYSIEKSDIIIISAPWDVTTSYRPGTHQGPDAIKEASLQVDLFDLNVKNAWKVKIGTDPVDQTLYQRNKKTRKLAEQVIARLEEGKELEEKDQILEAINQASEELNREIKERALKYMSQGKTVVILGGDHSVPLGNIRAVGQKHSDFGILHIDAHADLRKAYEGFKYSHASILYNALNEVPQISKLTQLGVRDFCQDEANIISADSRIKCYTDTELKKNSFEGKSWAKQCEEIIATLPAKIYITFDIDGLMPYLCPNTGTPVPGGLSFGEIDYLLWMLANSGKRIVGLDLCEVSPGDGDEWDANVGARILYKLCIYTHYNNQKINNQNLR
ncbi:MAG: agmatinase family protein [Bacteroidales bacterium]